MPQTISADAIANAFTSEGTRLGIDIEVEETEREGVTGDRGYFRVELPDGKKLVHWMKDGVPFSIQFGRCVQIIVCMDGGCLQSFCGAGKSWWDSLAYPKDLIGGNVPSLTTRSGRTHRPSRRRLRPSILRCSQALQGA